MAQNERYKIGDIVRLKSGGPRMTVNQIYDSGNVYCQWFAGNKLNSGGFEPNTIYHVKDEDEEEEA